MIYILAGLDDFSIRESLNEIKKGLGDETVLSLNSSQLEGQSVSPAELKTVCETVPFMAEKRLVVVNGLVGRFDPKSRKSRPTGAGRTAINEGECHAFGAAMNALPPSTVVVLVEEKVSSANPLFRLISAGCTMRSFPLLTGEKLQQWVRKRANTEGIAISPDAIRLLARVVGGNLWLMKNEITKLGLIAAGRQIEEADVRAVSGYAQETTIFALVDAILESRAGVAGRSLEQLKREGAAPAYILVMIARQARLIVLAGELRNEGCPAPDIQKRLGVTEFVLHKTMELAGRYSLNRVRDVYRRLLDADVAAKTGKYDGELALNILVAELCDRSPT